jgi:hypothetical protein
VERVLPDSEVKEKIGAIAVGLAADCDAPERDVEEIMRKNLAGKNALPFACFIGHDGTWVAGFSGYRDTAAFADILDTADKCPLLDATDAVRKKLLGLANVAGKSAERGDWKAVLRAGNEGAKTVGRCPEREALLALVKQARAWAQGELEGVADAARGADPLELKKRLAEVRKHFAGEPEGADADLGMKALGKLAQITAPEQREKAKAEYKDTRWARIFEEGAPAGEAPAEEAPVEEGSE